MIILIAGSTHTGKTLLAHRLVEKYHYSCLSLDHLKMGLIRSGFTELTPEDDDKMPGLLWPIVKEMIKTAIENSQDMIIEGCYIPFNWKEDFDKEYLDNIKYICLVMTEGYIEKHFEEIKKYASVIENRIDDSWLCKERITKCNKNKLEQCKKYGCAYWLIDDKYNVDELINTI